MVELGSEDLLVLLLASSTIFKEVRRPLSQGLLPGMDLARVDFKPAGQLCNGVLPLERGQSHFGLEDWAVLLTCFASCPAPSFRPILGAGLSLSHLSEFWGPPHASPESLMETWTEQIEKNPAPDVFLESASYGMGWNIVSYQGVELMTHDGSIGGFTSRMGFVPDAELGIVVLTNADLAGTLFNRDVHYRLVELALGLDPQINEFARAEYKAIVGLGDLFGQLQPVDPEVIAPFLGSYESIGSPWVVELRRESLRVSRGTVDTIELLAAPDGSYVAISGGENFLAPIL